MLASGNKSASFLLPFASFYFLFISFYFPESGLFNGLRAKETKKFARLPTLESRARRFHQWE